MNQGTWRGARLTKFGYLDNAGHAREGMRAQQKDEALRALKSILPASEYEVMVDQCQRGERELRLENGFVLTCFSPRE